MHFPISTYRVQLGKGLTFTEMRKSLDYLYDLGVTDIHASPILQAMPGSWLCKDTINFSKINPEIGRLDEFKRLSRDLHKLGFGWIQDLVPDHMAYSSLNPFIEDIMLRAEKSKFSSYFDILWERKNDPHLGKICAPFLEGNLENAIISGEISLTKKMKLKYRDIVFPVNQKSVQEVMDAAEIDDDDSTTEEERKVLQIREVNEDKWLLSRLLSDQKYNLEPTYNVRKEIDYRRPSSDRALISLNIDKEWVYEASHEFILQLVKDGMVDGLSLLHMDGLLDPGGYLMRLEESVHCYRVVDKALSGEEELPYIWDCNGTAGYDFLGAMSQLFTMKDSEDTFTRSYARFTGYRESYGKLISRVKREVLDKEFKGDLGNVVDTVSSAMQELDRSFSPDKEDVRAFVIELIVSMSFPRTYVLWGPVPYREELSRLVEMVRELSLRNSEISSFCDNYVRLLKSEKLLERLIGPVQQLSSSVMAKAREEIVLFRYNRLISLNELGSSPEVFGMPLKKFHSFIRERSSRWKHSLNSTSTQETLLGEDARARLSVLSEIPDQWFDHVKEWSLLNADYKTKINRESAPDLNDEYYIYQVMMAGITFDKGFSTEFKIRIYDHVISALRNSGLRTSWRRPDMAYEDAVYQFIDGIMNIYASRTFVDSFQKFHAEVAACGALNSLSQLAIKMTVPGVPEIYQGSELWNFSLMEPDNLRPLELQAMKEKYENLLAARKSSYGSQNLLRTYKSGLIKMHITNMLLQLRQDHIETLLEGQYIPLEVMGNQEKRIIAFARKAGNRIIITVAPRFYYKMVEKGKTSFREDVWDNTQVVLNWKLGTVVDALSNRSVNLRGKRIIPVSELLSDLPVAVLVGELEERKEEEQAHDIVLNEAAERYSPKFNGGK